jgi:Thiamine monophosphate synthase
MTMTSRPLYLVTDRLDNTPAEFLRQIDAACRGGVDLIQLREKTVSSREYYKLAKRCERNY